MTALEFDASATPKPTKKDKKRKPSKDAVDQQSEGEDIIMSEGSISPTSNASISKGNEINSNQLLSRFAT